MQITGYFPLSLRIMYYLQYFPNLEILYSKNIIANKIQNKVEDN